ncbi:EF-hand domain-containing protein [Synechococcus sp. MIT S1220]|uniref:EF-hand domain-containing protein n=1 Tax=Synechococcus sp. MIT S1220 TaxID=3082549 RepID=UPI0039B0FBD1
MAFPLRFGAVLVLLGMVGGLGPAMAGPGQTMRLYNNRMEALFLRLDINKDGRLDAGELKGHRALRRRLKRKKGRQYLLIDDLKPSAGQPGGRRLNRRFHRADSDRDQRLSRVEAASIPWLSRQFEGFDLNRDGHITLQELWEVQRSLAPPQRRP